MEEKVGAALHQSVPLRNSIVSWSNLDTWQNLGASVAGGAAGGAVQGAIVGAVAGAVAGVATGDLTVLALVGAATVARGMVGGAAGGATQSIVTQALSANSQGVNWDKVKRDAKVGATVGGVTAGLGFVVPLKNSIRSGNGKFPRRGFSRMAGGKKGDATR